MIRDVLLFVTSCIFWQLIAINKRERPSSLSFLKATDEKEIDSLEHELSGKLPASIVLSGMLQKVRKETYSSIHYSTDKSIVMTVSPYPIDPKACKVCIFVNRPTVQEEVIEEIVDFLGKLPYEKVNLAAVSRTYAVLLKERMLEKYDVKNISELETESCGLYVLPEGVKMNSKALPEGYLLQQLKHEDAVKVNENWGSRSSTSITFVEKLIAEFPSVGVYNENLELVCWCLTYDYGAFGFLYTVENFRRKGLGEVAVRALLNFWFERKKREKGWCFSPYAFIDDKNEKSMGLFRKIGFLKIGDVNWETKFELIPKELK